MRFVIALFLFAFAVVAIPHASFAQIDLGLDISVSTPPPEFPVYDQPEPPAPDYIWLPGYWAYDPYDGYYWVPGVWAEAPEPGLLWTPPYWAWNNGNYEFHDGYWGPHVGFYGGINYGFGYSGYGFRGGEWHGDHFENHPMPGPSHGFVGFNGGPGGIHAAPRPQDMIAAREQHFAPTSEQKAHMEAASHNSAGFANQNHGHPPVAAVARPVAAPQAQEHNAGFNREDYNTRVINSRAHGERMPVAEAPHVEANRPAPGPQPEQRMPLQPQHVQQQAPQHMQPQARPTAQQPHPEARPAEHAEPRSDDHEHGDDNRGH